MTCDYGELNHEQKIRIDVEQLLEDVAKIWLDDNKTTLVQDEKGFYFKDNRNRWKGRVKKIGQPLALMLMDGLMRRNINNDGSTRYFIEKIITEEILEQQYPWAFRGVLSMLFYFASWCGTQQDDVENSKYYSFIMSCNIIC